VFVTIRGHQVRIKFVDEPIIYDGFECDGLADEPGATDRTIQIRNSLTPARKLDVLIHEMLHIAYWDLSEEAISEAATDIARVLQFLGYRQEPDDNHQSEAAEVADSRVRTVGFAATSQSQGD
jgi:hypothetical protein